MQSPRDLRPALHTLDIISANSRITNTYQIETVTFQCRHRGTRRYSCTHFQPWSWKGVSGQSHAPTVFPPGMSPSNNFGGKLLGRRTGVEKRIFLRPLGFEPRRKLQYDCVIGPKKIGTGKSSNYTLDLSKTVFLYEWLNRWLRQQHALNSRMSDTVTDSCVDSNRQLCRQ